MQCLKLAPRISVLVLTRNRVGVLRNCITSILRQRFRDFEVVILDDASDTEDTSAAVAAELSDPRIRSYRVDSCLGVAGGRNFLMDKACGEILISIDDDAVFVGEDALEEVRTSFERSPKTGAVAFRITNVVSGERSPKIPFPKAIVSRNPTIATKRSHVAYFLGGGHAILKRIIQTHGGYRSDMFFGEEEMDLAYRIIQAGYCISYEPTIEVDHFPMPSVVGNHETHRSSELFYHVRNRAYLAYRYLPWTYAVPYLGTWMLRYAVKSVRDNNVSDFFRGACATPQFLRGVQRQVLDRVALEYLTKHGGRLWY